MNDTNYFLGIVKILEKPLEIKSKKKISNTQFRGELSQFRKNRMVHLVFWGNLAENVKTYYQINDYILIEGYLSIRSNKNLESLKEKIQKIEIVVLKVYPFLLKLDR